MTDIKARTDTAAITVEVTVATSMLRMRPIDFEEQLRSDDALSILLGRQALAAARTQLRAAAS